MSHVRSGGRHVYRALLTTSLDNGGVFTQHFTWHPSRLLSLPGFKAPPCEGNGSVAAVLMST